MGIGAGRNVQSPRDPLTSNEPTTAHRGSIWYGVDSMANGSTFVWR